MRDQAPPAVSYSDLLHTLELIRRATAPAPDDGGHHEAAFELADGILKKAQAHHDYVTTPRCAACGKTENIHRDYGSGGPYRCNSTDCMVW